VNAAYGRLKEDFLAAHAHKDVSMSRYLLSTHSFLCVTQGVGVLLDLKHDKYLTLQPKDVRALQEIVIGWPATQANTSPANEDETADTVAKELLVEGLLTRDPARGKPATPVSLELPTSSLLQQMRLWPELEPHHLVNFVIAWLTVTLMLRCLPLRWVVQRAHKRRARALGHAFDFDLEEAQRLSNNFLVLQPAFYSANNACLRDSLTLVEFLARYRVYPQCVFGVHTSPFAAHSWVQQGPTVLNETVEIARAFTPILVV
jgi:hypothetical protein